MTVEKIDDDRVFDQKTCPICTQPATLIAKVNTINPQADYKLDLNRCTSCAHWFHSPLPSQDYLLELYKTGSKFVSGELGYFDNVFDEEYFKKTRKTVVPDEISEKFNYLEVGVGNGKLFDYMSKFADASVGIEPGIWSPDNKKIIPSVDKLSTEHKFDIIVLFDVLEHLSEPIDLLTKLRMHAMDDALISITVPNSESTASKFLKSRWAMVRPFGHLHYFSKSSLEKVLSDSGWEIHSLTKKRDRQKSLIESISHIRNLKVLLYTALFGRDQWLVQAKPITHRKVSCEKT